MTEIPLKPIAWFIKNNVKLANGDSMVIFSPCPKDTVGGLPVYLHDDVASLYSQIKAGFDKLREALHFYGDPQNYDPKPWVSAPPTRPAGTFIRDMNDIEQDCGQIARQALDETE